jgi:hypothetical protein
VHQWRTPAFQCIEIDGFIVEGSTLSTLTEDTDPFEREGPHGGLMRFAFVGLLLVIASRPEGVADGFSRPLHEGLSQVRRTLLSYSCHSPHSLYPLRPSNIRFGEAIGSPLSDHRSARTQQISERRIQRGFQPN